MIEIMGSNQASRSKNRPNKLVVFVLRIKHLALYMAYSNSCSLAQLPTISNLNFKWWLLIVVVRIVKWITRSTCNAFVQLNWQHLVACSTKKIAKISRRLFCENFSQCYWNLSCWPQMKEFVANRKVFLSWEPKISFCKNNTPNINHQHCETNWEPTCTPAVLVSLSISLVSLVVQVMSR